MLRGTLQQRRDYTYITSRQFARKRIRLAEYLTVKMVLDNDLSIVLEMLRYESRRTRLCKRMLTDLPPSRVQFEAQFGKAHLILDIDRTFEFR